MPNDDIFVGNSTSDGGVFRSSDNGNTWVQVNSGFWEGPPDDPSLALGCLGKNSIGDVFLAASTFNKPAGIYRSTNNGDYWDDFGSFGLVWSLVHNSSDDIFAGTPNNGVYRMDAVYLDVEEGINTPSGFALSQNYPNPFNPSTRIEFELSRRSEVEVIIFNVLGQEVRTLVKRELSKGFHVIEWDGRDDAGNAVCSGVYHCRLKAGEYIESKKMVLLK